MASKIELQAEQMYTIELTLSGSEMADIANYLKDMPYYKVESAMKQIQEQLISKEK